jgi:hypothetical protein
MSVCAERVALVGDERAALSVSGVDSTLSLHAANTEPQLNAEQDMLL